MKVKELIEKLQVVSQDKEVFLFDLPPNAVGEVEETLHEVIVRNQKYSEKNKR